MRILAIETATEACSVALFEDAMLVDARHEVLGRGHAEKLIPMIAALPGKGRAERIVVSLGPGSFTGVRIGIAAARALGVAWQAEVLGYPTLSLIAAIGAHEHSGPVTVCMHGGHGEWFVQNFDAAGDAEETVQSLAPAAAKAAARHTTIAGNRATDLGQIIGDDGQTALDLLPDARHFPLLGDRHLTDQLTPIYGRAPDAKLPSSATS